MRNKKVFAVCIVAGEFVMGRTRKKGSNDETFCDIAMEKDGRRGRFEWEMKSFRVALWEE